jgi:glycosyltransferase involved in cell wall biosynthesis
MIPILQRVLPKYRLPLFKMLSENLNIKVLYSLLDDNQRPSITNSNSLLFKTQVVKIIDFHNILYFQLLPYSILYSKVVIMDANLRIISNVLLFYIRKIISKKNILWTHGFGVSRNKIIRLLQVNMMKNSDAILLYEDEQMLDIINAGISQNKVFIVKNSLDYTQMTNTVDVSDERFRITYIGRLSSNKRVEMLINAFKKLGGIINTKMIVLTIIGDGECYSTIKAFANNMNNIKIIGPLYDEYKISTYLNQTIVTVSPDNVGLMIHHSYAYSVPVLINYNPLTRNGPEVCLVEDNQTGLFFNGSEDDLIRKLQFAVLNPKKMGKMGKNAHKILKKNYSIENMVNQFVKSVDYVLTKVN